MLIERDDDSKKSHPALDLKESAMDQVEPKDGIGTRLRRAWDTALRAAEMMSASPMGDITDRIDRLERDVAAMKERPFAKVTR
jgi:polyhydroxyalkanoate synthesis regulator phasin